MSWTDKLLATLLDAFPDTNIVALCRYDFQVDEIRGKFGSKCFVPDDIVSGHDLLASTDLFVGMGGTMNAEAALMGVPTISAFQGSLYTDRYLESVGLLAKALTPSTLKAHARRLLAKSFKAGYRKKARRVLDSMEDPVPRIAKFVEKTANQA